MYVKTLNALVWVDSPDDHPLSPSPRCEPKPLRPAPQTRYARKPFEGRLGRYIAVRRIPAPDPRGRELLLVAVANKSASERGPWWVRAENALTEREAALWLRDGF